MPENSAQRQTSHKNGHSMLRNQRLAPDRLYIHSGTTIIDYSCRFCNFIAKMDTWLSLSWSIICVLFFRNWDNSSFSSFKTLL